MISNIFEIHMSRKHMSHFSNSYLRILFFVLFLYLRIFVFIFQTSHMGMLYLISLNPMLSKNSINVVSLITPVVFIFDFVR